MAPDWQRRRNTLNHDWLKNEFMRHLRAFIARAEAPSPDRSRLVEFAIQDWPTWKARRGRLLALLESSESELSPRQLLNESPLSRSAPEIKTWLEGIVHVLWLARTSIRRQIDDAQSALADADQKYRQLEPLLVIGEAVDPEKLRQAVGSFRAFEAAVERLSTRISSLPHKIQVV